MEDVSTAIESAKASKAEERAFLHAMMDEKWVSIKTTSEYLGFNEDTLRRYAGLKGNDQQPALLEGEHWVRHGKASQLFFRIGKTEEALRNLAVTNADGIRKRMAHARDQKGTEAPAE